MNANRPGITFRETMAGGFSLGEQDPETGNRTGKAAGHILSMHATIAIDDIEKFVADAKHNGSISGSIDYPPIGENLPSKTGVFSLFSPTDDPHMRYMVYELGFEANGENYYLAGRKHVKDDPGFDLWSDTTTLYTRLHQGTDSQAPVVGAGVLSLGVTDLMSLLSTLRATNADTVNEKTKALTTFGRFFLGSLWDSYASRVMR